MLSVGSESAAKGTEFRGDDIAALVGLVLKDGELVVAIELEVAVVRGGSLGMMTLSPVPSVAIQELASSCFQCNPLKPERSPSQIDYRSADRI
jgi:hypothetical protein